MDSFSWCLKYQSSHLELTFCSFLPSLALVQSQDQSHSQSANVGSRSRVRQGEIPAWGQNEAILLLNQR